MSKPSWLEYYLGIAEAASKRSSCVRSKVGAVVVKDNRVRAVGYNDSPAGKPGCDSCPRRSAEAVPGESPYDRGPTRCVALHAEANALLHCDRADLVGATLYVTREPCYQCSLLIEGAGITEVIWPEKLEMMKAEWESFKGEQLDAIAKFGGVYKVSDEHMRGVNGEEIW